MNMQELTLKKERIASIGKWALALIAAAVISPLVFLAIKGLIGLIIAGVLGLTIVNLSPWLSMKFANWKLKGMSKDQLLARIAELDAGAAPAAVK